MYVVLDVGSGLCKLVCLYKQLHTPTMSIANISVASSQSFCRIMKVSTCLSCVASKKVYRGVPNVYIFLFRCFFSFTTDSG